jgi:hypothetical protein
LHEYKEGVVIMNIKIVSKDLEATEAIKDYIAKKMERVEKYFGDTELNVNILFYVVSAIATFLGIYIIRKIKKKNK